MLHKWIGFTIVMGWAIATSWLVWHDIVPGWTAQDPPRVVASDWVNRYGRQSHFGIYNQRGERIGGIWTRYTSAASTDRIDEIYINDMRTIGAICVHIKSIFDLAGKLDEVDMNVLSAAADIAPIRIHGERFPSQFAFRLDAGAVKHVFKVDLAMAGTFSATFRPFDAMPNLTVGQSWRMQVFNPIAALTGFGDEFIPMVVKVVGREPVRTGGALHDCLIIESSGLKGWVDRTSGVVLLQEISVPLGGTYTIKNEEYVEMERKHAAKQFEDLRDGVGHRTR